MLFTWVGIYGVKNGTNILYEYQYLITRKFIKQEKALHLSFYQTLTSSPWHLHEH